ncbi:rhodanese-like domain-containing protein [Sulfurimonas sp. HSL3-7]|uniref:rhodanese-like domain-containing protein n=1 Tax=Sulfonitrofixus jiaomeiensis TaxID=3131938 RepID=UPI0031F81432
MRYLITFMLLMTTLLQAEIIIEPISQELLAKKVPLIDIRTEGEWKETGIIKGAIPITFFNEQGQYDLEKFLAELNAKVDTKKEFALICRSGSRSNMVGKYLSDKLGYKVIDIQGGMLDARQRNVPVVPYEGQ